MIYGTEQTKAAVMPEFLADRGITFPAMLDARSAYRTATRVGAYPLATLLDPDGRVVWQGQPFWRKAFAEACTQAIESVIATEDHADAIDVRR